MRASHPHPVKHGASWRTKSQIQALDRTAPMLPLRPGLAARRTHDYKRHGTTTLFAALEIATGKITADACYPRHRHQEFLRFLKKAAAVTFTSVKDLTARVGAFIDAYNDRCQPFTWTKDADESRSAIYEFPCQATAEDPERRRRIAPASGRPRLGA
jgi:hypothetical protein